MIEDLEEDWDADVAPTAELVHWMAPKPMAVGPVGLSAATLGAFAVGAAATLAVLALLHLVGPEREIERPRLRWRSSVR